MLAIFMHATVSTSAARKSSEKRMKGNISIPARIGIGRAKGSGTTRAPIPFSVAGYCSSMRRVEHVHLGLGFIHTHMRLQAAEHGQRSHLRLVNIS